MRERKHEAFGGGGGGGGVLLLFLKRLALRGMGFS